MKAKLERENTRGSISGLPVVKNFKQVIGARDIGLVNKELYQFLTLYCGFIAHYNIDGFKATYSDPRGFADVFIRHFDREHRYFSRIYPCDREQYKDTGYSKAEIKEEFYRIVQAHKDSTVRWASEKLRNERRAMYLWLKEEFEPEGLRVNCEACGNDYRVRVVKEGEEFNDFGIICCVFCGRQTRLY